MMDALLNSMIEFGVGGSLSLLAGVTVAVPSLALALRSRMLLRRERAQRLHTEDMVEHLSEGIYRSSLDGHQLNANKALVRLNGFDSKEEMLAAVTDIERQWYVDPNRRSQFREILMRDGKVEDFISEIYRYKTRERIWITESARVVRDVKSGKPIYYEGSVREITETVQRLDQEEQFRKLTRRLPVGLFHFVSGADGSATILFLSETASRISGIPMADQLSTPSIFVEVVHPEDLALFRQAQQHSAQTLEPWDCEFRIKALDGEEKWLRVNAQLEAVGSEIHWYGYLADISSRKQQDMEIEELAYYDPLTKLPNRRMFFNRMTQSLTHCRRSGDFGSLLYIDLDNFKTLNDTQGHDTGDALLVQVAARLKSCVSPRDLVARIGGDEFVIVIEDAASDEGNATLRGITVGNRVVAELKRGFDIGNLHHVGSASIGVVVFDGSHVRPDEIIKRADIAMYQAKSAGRNGLALFDPETMTRESERYQMVADLRTAFAEDQFVLHFQPQVDFNGKVTGAEGLVRWNHPTKGLIRPQRFVSLAEQNGMNDDLARHVFNQGFAALSSWQVDPTTEHLRLSLNVSVQSFANDGFVPMVKELVNRHGVDAAKITFELTEHVMAKDHERIAKRMGEIKQLGIRLSLDDFGTGYSSLAHLKQLPFDEVKIDGGFVSDLENSESDRALVKTILAMARTLGLTSVAEHVENVRQEAFLRAFGCDYLQGYFYSPAVPATEFLSMFMAGAEDERGVATG
jgi:diguanylate cyclase (GGDEF)-like protein/PAS domain S-box-containing protein